MKFISVDCPNCRTRGFSPWANFRATVRKPATCRNCGGQFYRRHFVYGAVEAVVITFFLIGLFIVFVVYGGLATLAAAFGAIGILAGIWALEVKAVRLRELTDVQRNDATLITQICGFLFVIGLLALIGTLAYDVYTHQ